MPYLLVDLYKAKQEDYLSYALPKLLMFISCCLADWSLAKLEFIQFAADGPTLPFWLVLLWLLFSITFEKCYRWLSGKLKVAALLGGLFGPASYWAASKLSSVSIQMPVEFTLFSAVFWATLFVTFIKRSSLAA